MSEETARHQVTRIRRETRRRAVTVSSVERLTPHMLRVRFESPELVGFESAAPDDHVKLFIPAGEGEEPAKRDYTPRAFDAAAGTLTIDFALHEAGPATAWAEQAKPGDVIAIGGPRGSAVVTDDFDWYWLIGDETAIPAILRRIEELRPDVPVTALIAIDGEADRQPVAARAGLEVIWSPRDGDAADDTARLIGVLDARRLPSGDGYVWIAAEAGLARALRTHVVEALGHPREWTKAAGYWSRGTADAHERIGD